jgi:hypothetical protein
MKFRQFNHPHLRIGQPAENRLSNTVAAETDFIIVATLIFLKVTRSAGKTDPGLFATLRMRIANLRQFSRLAPSKQITAEISA